MTRRKEIATGDGETAQVNVVLLEDGDLKFLDWADYWEINKHGRSQPYLSQSLERSSMVKKLNLGCGSLTFSQENGWVNMDQNEGPGIIQHDIYHIPWPFNDNTFDVIFMSNILEHICPIRWFEVMAELFRVSRDCAIWEIHGPDPANSITTLQAPSHTSLVGPWSFFGYIHPEKKGDLNLGNMAMDNRLIPLDGMKINKSRPVFWTQYYGAYIGSVNDYHLRKYLGRGLGELISRILGRPWTLRMVFKVVKEVQFKRKLGWVPGQNDNHYVTYPPGERPK